MSREKYRKLQCSRWLDLSGGESGKEDSMCAGCRSDVMIPHGSGLLSDEQIIEQDRRLANIRNHIKDKNAALVLGAGISVPSGIPVWSALISKMLGYALQEGILKERFGQGSTGNLDEYQNKLRVAQQLIEKEVQLFGKVNTLESAEYIAQFFQDDAAEDWIRKKLPEVAISTMVAKMINESKSPAVLYGDGSLDGDSLRREVQQIGDSIVASGNTMFAVSYLLSKENGIRKAMTYNYDPLVQEHMMGLYGIAPDKIRTHPGKWNGSSADDLREIYHVHGFVTGKRHDATGLKGVYPPQSEVGPLVLSEDSYYKIEQQEAYNWSSSTQSYFLNKYNCVFVGFSAEDYNFRRILRQQGDLENDKQSKPWHYLILTIDNWARDTYESVCLSALKKQGVIASSEQIAADTTFLLQEILDSREKYWKSKHILPIWVTKEEIPKLLTSLVP